MAIKILQRELDSYEPVHTLAQALSMAIEAMEHEPKTDIALDRYRDLQDYFSDEAVAKTILENKTEFKSWLKRLKWNTKKVDELARKLEALEQEPILDKIRTEIEKEIIPRNSDQYDHEAMWQNCGLRMALKAIDKYKAGSEE